MTRPHIILLMADQLRRDVLGCYGGGYGVSPAIDALAGESAVFRSHAINAPLCVPSRISMLTGTWPHVNGAIVNGWDEPEREFGRCRDMPTMYESLAEAGYRVEHVGVDHLRCEPPLPDRHERIRFRANPGEFMQMLKRDGMAVATSVTRSPTMDYIDGKPVMRMYSNANTLRWPHPPEKFLDCWLADRVIEAIQSHDPSEPLALMGCFWSPHPPLSCPEPYYSMYDPDSLELPETVGQWCPGQSPIHLTNLPGHVSASLDMAGWRKAWAVYLGMVRLLDDCIARVIAALKDQGYWDNAVVIFTSDHGEMLGSHRLYQKMCMYEESIRVPMLVKGTGSFSSSEKVPVPFAGPRGAEMGTGTFADDAKEPVPISGQRRQLTQHLDLAATLCDYAGAPVPAASRGESFRPIVEDPDAPGREEVFAEYNGNSGRSFQQRALITPTHKYIYNHGYEGELYDLTNDPFEKNNLCQDDPPALASEMRDRLRQWMVETNDPTA